MTHDAPQMHRTSCYILQAHLSDQRRRSTLLPFAQFNSMARSIGWQSLSYTGQGVFDHEVCYSYGAFWLAPTNVSHARMLQTGDSKASGRAGFSTAQAFSGFYRPSRGSKRNTHTTTASMKQSLIGSDMNLTYIATISSHRHHILQL